jgi:uncharacterized protein YaaN involved in tellurite resistance
VAAGAPGPGRTIRRRPSRGRTTPPTPDGRDPGRATALNTPPPDEAAADALVPPEVLARIDELVAAFVEDVAGPGRDDGRLRARLVDIGHLGAPEVLATTRITARIADRSAEPGLATDELDDRLAALRRIVEDLDPARFDLDEAGPRRVFGVVPAGDRLDAYLERHGEARGRVDELIAGLHEDADALALGAAARRQDQRALAIEVEALRRYVVMAGRLDAALEERIAGLETADPARARQVGDEVLLPVRARRRDLVVHLAVGTQALLALRALDEDAAALGGAITAATTTTRAALETASVVARVLANRRAVHGPIGAATGAGADAVDAASGFVRQLGPEAGDLAVALDELRGTWRDAASALDAAAVAEASARRGESHMAPDAGGPAPA